MKKLSHRHLVLISHLLILAHPVYYWLRELTEFRSDLVYMVLLAANLVMVAFPNRSQKQMDEYSDRAMKQAESACFAVGVIAMALLGFACISKAPWADLRTVGLLLLTIASVLMVLRGVIFSILDKQGMD